MTQDTSENKPSPPKKRGAPLGNKNALRHGLYAKHFTESERARLGDMPALESLHEIHMLRAKVEDLLTLIEECEDEDRRVKLYNSLFTGTQRLLFAMRTHTHLVGDNREILMDFWKALEAFQDDLGL